MNLVFAALYNKEHAITVHILRLRKVFDTVAHKILIFMLQGEETPVVQELFNGQDTMGSNLWQI
jgi:hypothetical protein